MNVPSVETNLEKNKNKYVLIHIEMIKDKEVNESEFTSLIKLELSIIPNEVSENTIISTTTSTNTPTIITNTTIKPTNTTGTIHNTTSISNSHIILQNGIAVINQIKDSQLHFYQLKKVNEQDDTLIIEMSPCSNDIEFRLKKSKFEENSDGESTNGDFIDLNPLLENGRYISYFSPISNTNYIEVKNNHIDNPNEVCNKNKNNGSKVNCTNDSNEDLQDSKAKYCMPLATTLGGNAEIGTVTNGYEYSCSHQPSV